MQNNLQREGNPPQNISLVRQKNTKEVIINQEGTRMVKDGEDSHGLQMINLKNLG